MAPPPSLNSILFPESCEAYMIKAEWGTKRSCPKCATRFYDLTKDDPITCINCGYAWVSESVLKSKQPMPFEEAQKPAKVVAEPRPNEDPRTDKRRVGKEWVGPFR